jgi:hypothetical protein
MPNNQVCPICSNEVPPNPLYLDYVCEQCVTETSDQSGQRVKFTTDYSTESHIVGTYVDSDNAFTEPVCYVRGVECKVSEARLGGIIVQPANH